MYLKGVLKVGVFKGCIKGGCIGGGVLKGVVLKVGVHLRVSSSEGMLGGFHAAPEHPHRPMGVGVRQG